MFLYYPARGGQALDLQDYGRGLLLLEPPPGLQSSLSCTSVAFLRDVVPGVVLAS